MGNKVPYPWLASQDLKRFQTDREILEQLIDLLESSLTPSIKEEFYVLLEEYKKYFSLYNQLGLVQRMEINLESTDTCHLKKILSQSQYKRILNQGQRKRKYENKDISRNQQTSYIGYY